MNRLILYLVLATAVFITFVGFQLENPVMTVPGIVAATITYVVIFLTRKKPIKEDVGNEAAKGILGIAVEFVTGLFFRR